MKLRDNLKTISNNTGINIEDKTIYSLQKYINNLHLTPTKAHDFEEMVLKIEESYLSKSQKMEEYFIKNIAHIQNSNTGENLFDLSKIDISKNYFKIRNETAYEKLSSMSKYYNTAQKAFTIQNKPWKLAKYEDEMIELSNSLYMYSHNNSTSFIEEFNSKYGYKKLAKVKYIDYKNSDKIPVMATFTLDKYFRKYKLYEKYKDSAVLGDSYGLKEINKHVNLEDIIEKSYHKLNEIFRSFYEYFKHKNSRSGDEDKLDFILVFEPHKSLTLHMHALFYCNGVQLKNLEDAWENYLKDLTPKQKKGQDFKVIDTSIANASTYLSKYLIKEYNNEENDISFYNKYKSYFSKFKFFRTSNFYHTTQKKIDLMYQYLCKNYPDILELIKSTTVPIYEILEQFEIKGLFNFEKEKVRSVSFDRDGIKEFYEFTSTSNNNKDYKIKKEIIENIYSFTNTITISRIKSASFNYDHDLLVEILESYEIETKDLIVEENIPLDKFYEVGMYEIQEHRLYYSLILGDSMLME
jgi:hypothetical protein